MNNNNTPSYEQLINHTEATNRLLSVIATSLKAIEHSLTTLEQSQAPLSPNYRRRYREYSSFNWQSIGAKIVATDTHGAAEVEWSGHRFDRTTGEKFNEKFIIFSRPTPEWTQTNKTYHTLIKFADYNKTPLDPQPEQEPAPAPTSTPPPPTADDGTLPPADYRKQEARRRRAGQIKQPNQPKSQAQPQTVSHPSELTGSRNAQRPDQQSRPAHWASQPEAQPPQPEREPATNNPQSAIPNPQFLAEAQQITDPPAFYEFVNKLIQQDKTVVQRLKPIVDDPATNWAEKAVMLIGG
jgi:hypothetical protein